MQPSTPISNRRRLAAILAVVLLTLLAAAWGVMALAPSGALGTDAHAYRIRVMRDRDQIASYTVPQLGKLGVAHLKIDGKTQSGPRLTTLLRDAGVKSYSTVTIKGMGVRDKGALVLRHAQVDGQILIDIAKRGTAKVVGPHIAWADRVRDITQIIVR